MKVALVLVAVAAVMRGISMISAGDGINNNNSGDDHYDDGRNDSVVSDNVGGSNINSLWIIL